MERFKVSHRAVFWVLEIIAWLAELARSRSDDGRTFQRVLELRSSLGVCGGDVAMVPTRRSSDVLAILADRLYSVLSDSACQVLADRLHSVVSDSA